MKKIKERIIVLKQNNKFLNWLLNMKNLAIIILSLLLFCYIIAYLNSNPYKYYFQIENLTNQVNELNIKNKELNLIVEDNKKQITNLQNANKILQEEKQKLEGEKQTLENKNNELTTKIEELEKLSTEKSKTPSTNTSQQAQSEGRQPCKVCH